MFMFVGKTASIQCVRLLYIVYGFWIRYDSIRGLVIVICTLTQQQYTLQASVVAFFRYRKEQNIIRRTLRC